MHLLAMSRLTSVISLALLSAVALSGASASPVMRSDGPPLLTCPDGVNITTLPYNFTLAAFNITLPNSNQTGAPLVLGEAGAVDGAEFEIVSTYASYPYNDFPSLFLLDATVGAWSQEGTTDTNATGTRQGGSINFYSSGLPGAPRQPAYSVLECPGNPFPIFATYGRPDIWSLCPGNQAPYQSQLIFNVSAAVGSPYILFDPSDCYEVAVNVVLG